MSLFVRVFNSFYTHRKTARLKAVIGEAAYWVPPRLWAYAAENQPDGCFADYSPEEIAMLIGYLGDAQAMLQAMLRASFMDDNPLRIHDWSDYNDYHAKYSERAKKAANARWGNKPSPTPPSEKRREDRRGEETSIAQASVKQCLEHEEASSGPEWDSAKKWLADWTKNGADYTEFEARGAFLALQANGWMWGRNPVVDPRAALERQIQNDRQRNQKHGPNSQNGKPTVSQLRNKHITGAEHAGRDAAATVARRQKEYAAERAGKTAQIAVAAKVADNASSSS